MTHFIHPRFAKAVPKPEPKKLSPEQLRVLWAYRAQKATELQTKGVWHI